MRDAKLWSEIYSQVPLSMVPSHFEGMTSSPFLFQYLATVLRIAPSKGRALETGVGSGYGTIWLSQRGLNAEGIDYTLEIVERARQINNVLNGSAVFRAGDLFDLYSADSPRYDVVHHQGVLEHFTVPQIRAALAQQVALGDHVVFSVPSVNYPFDPEFGNERLMPIEEWEWILEPFDVAELKYYGDPKLGAKEQILCTLRGQDVSESLLGLMHPAGSGFLPGVSAIVHTRNESVNILDCLQTLAPWADQIIVCDMESTDDTVARARHFTSEIVVHPLIANFDQSRNVSAMRARHEWVFFLDADERVPQRLGEQLRGMAHSGTADFDGLLIPFRHHFAGHWMRSMYPGYTAPRLLRNGKFIFNARLHSGAVVDGPVIAFPANDPELALVHYSFDSLSHYLDKLNRYTDGESLNMWRDGKAYHWQNAIGHFVQDFKSYYESGHATVDGVHGFLYSFQSAFYRFFQHGKLYERRFRAGQLSDWEQSVPASMEEMLEFALRVCRQEARPEVKQLRVTTEHKPDLAEIVWSGPIRDRSGYGDESRNLLLALESVRPGQIAAQALPWGPDADMSDSDKANLDLLAGREVGPGFTQIVHTFGSHLERHPQAGTVIGRTVFETDRLPKSWVTACNKMDAVWVPSEFNRKTFKEAGVDPDKIAVVPECLDASRYGDSRKRDQIAADETVPVAVRNIAGTDKLTFLSVFDWSLHKGWDILLRAFLQEFGSDEPVQLALKVWSSNGYTDSQILEQARLFAKDELGVDVDSDDRVVFIQDYLTEDALLGLYLSSDCYVMPSRGEGWGRPYMEAMACGLPTIGTGWGGNVDFMSTENSLLVGSKLVPVPEKGWRELATYKGHLWAEPDAGQLRSHLRWVASNRQAAKELGATARRHVLANFSRESAGPNVAAALASIIRQKSAIVKPDSQTLEYKSDPMHVRWEGAILRQHSLSHVNRELVQQLIDLGVDITLVPTEPTELVAGDDSALLRLQDRHFAPLTAPADVHVRHGFPPRFGVPDEGHFVLMQPWEYGYLPKEWLAKIEHEVTEVWCNSKYVMGVYANSGVPKKKLRHIPLGVDTSLFNEEALPYVFTDEPGAFRLGESTSGDPFMFLYVGGTIQRKGFDILLDAYLKAFSAYDNVALVVKATGTRTVYSDSNYGERLTELANDPSRPRIVYIDTDLSAREMAGVYRAADLLVAPYRGEGFCLPALESLACGTPVLVTRGGPTDDFVDETVGWRVPALKLAFDESKIGHGECAGPTWMFEVDPIDLAKQLRSLSNQKEECRSRGAAGAKRVADNWTWRHSAQRVLKRLAVLKVRPQTKVEKRPSAAGIVKAAGKIARLSSGDGSKPTISLCMIVKNEERVLGDCLTSIKPWVDEIIVVDTGSTDRTVAIAEESGARVFHFPWTDSFSEARNESLRHATGEWILWMDADDTIFPESGAKLRDAAMLASEKVAGLIMQVRIPAAAGEYGETVVDHVKLFRNGIGLQFEGRIHEQILEPIYRAGGEIQRTDLFVVHSGYDYSPEGQKAKRVRDLRLLELDLADRPDHPFVLFNIGMTAFHMRDFSKSIDYLKRCLSVCRKDESVVRKVYAMLAGASFETGNHLEAVRWLDKGLGLYPRDPELLFRGGAIFRETGNAAKAEECYLKLLADRESGHIDSIDQTMTGFKAHHNLAILYQETGRPEKAKSEFAAAVNLQPDFMPSRMALAALSA